MKILNKDNFLHDISIEKNYKSSLKILNQTGIEYKNDYLKNKKIFLCSLYICNCTELLFSKNNLFAKLLRKFFKKINLNLLLKIKNILRFLS